MKHLGDITKISGYTAPIVDCVIGGSPCQDLSVAGKRAGLEGERSGLFMEQIRIVKELRKQDERNGRTDVDIRPRYMVWENVPGAFSSNKGEDFRVVLEEIAKVKDENASIPMPKDGKWATSGSIVGDGWSLAWRVLDAQFWGVPQRRRRIALVADFGGESSSEILFVSKSLSGHIDESQQKRKDLASNVAGGTGANDCLGADQYNAAILGDTVSTLGVNCGMSHGRQCVLEPITFEPGIASREGGHVYENVSGTLRANAGDNQMSTAYTFEAVVYAVDQGGGKSSANVTEGVTPTLACTHGGEPVIALGRTSFNQNQNTVRTRYIVRRLTPLECERLQGYPDGWTDIGEYIDSNGKKRQTSDAARYKALGNSIALPPWKWVLKRICACYERDATMGSLFDGISGFVLLWTQLNGLGSVKWTSEIDEFPMAVCKRHFGDEETGEKGDFYEAILGRNKKENV